MVFGRIAEFQPQVQQEQVLFQLLTLTAHQLVFISQLLVVGLIVMLILFKQTSDRDILEQHKLLLLELHLVRVESLNTIVLVAIKHYVQRY